MKKQMDRIFAVLVGLLVLSPSPAALAQSGELASGWDAQLGAGLRSYPVGASVHGTAGYNWLLWTQDGAKASESNGDSAVGSAGGSASPQWKFGYLRPLVKLQTSGIVNAATAELEFYPISIFGIAIGENLSGRNLKPADEFDCQLFHCGGRLQRKFVRSQLALAAGPYFFILKGRWEEISPSQDDRDFLEESSNLLGDRHGDRLETRDAIIGYRLSDSWRFAVAGTIQRFAEAQTDNQVVYLAAGFGWADWQVMSGVGQYQSTHQEPGLAAFLTLSWTVEKGLALF